MLPVRLLSDAIDSKSAASPLPFSRRAHGRAEALAAADPASGMRACVCSSCDAPWLATSPGLDVRRRGALADEVPAARQVAAV